MFNLILLYNKNDLKPRGFSKNTGCVIIFLSKK